jgi:hypothetical protein
MLLCPLCDYDLRGLAEPRCPECGYRFEWAELTDPARRRHPYLFEHHPEHNARSFVRTLVGGLRPRRFWATLYPTQRSRPGRLLVYFLLVCATGLVPAVFVAGRDAEAAYGDVLTQRSMYLRYFQGPGSGPAMLRTRYPGMTAQQAVDQTVPLPTLPQLLQRWRVIGLLPALLFLLLGPPAWVGLTAAAMMVFRISMRRARVRPIHALRCALYSGDVIAWVNLLLSVVMAVAIFKEFGTTNVRGHDELLAELSGAILIVGWLTFAYRFWIALRRYLRFDHAVATVIATQVMVLLTALVILSNLAAGGR